MAATRSGRAACPSSRPCPRSSRSSTHPFKDHPDAPLFYTENASDYARAVRAMESGDEEETLDALHLTPPGCGGILNRIVKHSGVRKRVTPHSSRHSRAPFFAARGVTEAALRARFEWSPTTKTPATYQHLSGS